jgi:hypothetical protein
VAENLIRLLCRLSHSVQNRLGADNKKVGGLQVTGISTFLSKRLKWPDDYFTLTHALSYNRYNLIILQVLVLPILALVLLILAMVLPIIFHLTIPSLEIA